MIGNTDIQSNMNTLCLHQWFEIQASKTPEAIAVVFEDQCITYRELENRANQLAHRLRSLGVGPDILVALCLERSLDMIVGILGILKSGSGYLPMDPAYPKDRLMFMLQDAKTPVLLTQGSLLPTLTDTGTTVVCIDDDFTNEPDTTPDVMMKPDHLAYCIYTSGSTGKPKGVLITHRNVVRLFKETEYWFRFNSNDIWTLFHSSAFDVSVWEMFGALLYGGRLIVVPYLASRSPVAFYELLEREAVTVLSQTPSAFRQLTWAESSISRTTNLRLRYIIFEGEKLEFQLLRPWFEKHGDQRPQLINMYGITETTVHVTYRPLTIKDTDGPSAIGQPIPDLQIHLLGENNRPVADGQPGEICVAGPGLARGYLNRDELTAARFVTLHGQRIYRSGDLARRLPDGDLEYIGRIDNQVKIRGHRIELGEIESVLQRHERVSAGVVISLGERLAAYIVAKKPSPTVSELRNFVKQYLPEYMVPATFTFVDALPLTANGKVNRRALPDPGGERPRLMRDFVAPETDTESTLAQILSEVLGVAPVGVHDNFFELGGDSIRMIQFLAQAREHKIALTPAQLFRTPTIRALADHVGASELQKHSIKPFALISNEDLDRLPDDVEDAYPLTALQAGMHYHVEIKPASGIFHDVYSYRIGFPFDENKFREALQRLLMRHETLRTSFDFASYSESVQMVHQTVSARLEIEDLRELKPDLQHKALLAWIESEKQKPFEVRNAPLARFHIQRLSEKQFQLIVSFHHSILDGWSLAVMVSELLRDYAALLKGMIDLVAPPRTPYREFVATERRVVASVEYRRFWEEYLAGAVRQPLPRWPKSFCRGGNEQARGPDIAIGPEVFEGLNRLAAAAGAPLRTVLLAAHFWTVKTLSGHTDVISGVVVNGRPEERDGERMLGLFLNVLPMRMNIAGGTWLELVRQTYEGEGSLLPYRRYPLAEIQKHFGGFAPFEAAFNYVNWHVFRPLRRDLGMEFEEGDYFETNNFIMLANFILDISGKQLTLHFNYDPEQIAEKQAQALGDYYLATLAAMALHPADRYQNFCSMPELEKRQLLNDWNATSADYPSDRCIHELFEMHAETSPESVALVLNEDKITYGELNRRADQLAGYLRSCGVGPDALVGLCMDRSKELVVAMLGILKAGGAYVPLDPSYPYERLEWMIADTGMKVMLTHSKIVEKIPGKNLETICLDTFSLSDEDTKPALPVTPDILAYVMYTSGSTGIPKGVAVTHRGVVRLLFGTDYVTLDSHQTLLHHSTISFDASTFELWGALLHGARCVLLPENISESKPLGEAIQKHGVTTLWLTAALYNSIIDEAPQILRPVKQVLIGGEALSPDHVQRGLQSLPDTRIVNGYGPTESTTFACCYNIPQIIEENTSSVPIGRPIGNTQLYILNDCLQPVPIGVTGELYIGGVGLARGYLNRPQLTADRFIPHPFSDIKGARLYRTGDLARYLPDGKIEFMGRQDYQVKIRGFRIELGEIEAALQQHPDVKEAVVVVREDQPRDKRLVGYIVGNAEPAPTVEDLRDYLSQKLPHYMIPSTFLSVRALPLNAQGKVDRTALAGPGQSRPELKQGYEPPRTSTETIVARVWAQVLKLEKVGVHDNFLQLGGDSLLATQIISRVRNAFQTDVPLSVMFEHPTVAGLSNMLDKAGDTEELLFLGHTW